MYTVNVNTNLASVFRLHVSHLGAGQWQHCDLERRLHEIHAASQDIWPGLAVPADVFVRHLAANLPDKRDLADSLARLHGPDLYLACGCMLGLSAAIVAFDRKVLVQTIPALRRMGLSGDGIDEILQLVRTRLLVASEERGQPMIASYAGRGPLLGWVRTTVRRVAVSTKRKKDERLLGTEEQDTVDSLSVPRDLERDYLKARYQRAFRQAVEDAISALGANQMTVLRLHYMDGLSIDRIGAIMQVHRATAARWIKTAEEAVRAGTRRLLRVRLGSSDSELDGLIALVQSQISISIGRLLQR